MSLYLFARNSTPQSIDPNGLWFVTCGVGALANDTGWVGQGAIPSSDYFNFGGNWVSSGAELLYLRTKTYNHACTCVLPCNTITKTSTLKYGTSVSWTAIGNQQVTWGPWGASIPIEYDPLSLIVGLLLGEMTFPIVSAMDANMVSGQLSVNAPPDTVDGDLIDDSGLRGVSPQATK